MVLLTFNVEWFDSSAQMVREYRLHCYENATIEIIETGTRRTFLKRISYPQIQPDDLYLGSTVTVFTRQLQIVGYCDTGTRDYVESHRVPTTFAIDVKGGGDAALSSALNLVATEAPLSRAKMVQLGAGRCLLVQVLLPNAAAVERLVALSDGALSAVADADKLFAAPACMEQTDACTLCMIKPHLTRGKDVGKLLQDLVARGYALGGLESFSLSRTMVTEFLGVYKGVLPYYADMTGHLTEGPVIAVQLLGGPDQADVVTAFREDCGPADVELARVLRPKSIRANFGSSRVENAVHCTDLPEDGLLECQYFFQTISAL